MKLPPQPWEFRSKPAWQRLIIMCGGVTVNVILGVLIYAMVLFAWGEQYLPTKNAKYGIACDSTALRRGFKDGDKILSVDNKEIENFNKIPLEIILNKAKNVQVDRDGQKLDIPIKEEYFSELIKGKASLFDMRMPCEVDSVIPGMAADLGGLKKGDKILSIETTIALLLPFTYDLGPLGALIMLAGIYYGAQYGGSTTAILVNVPGETTSLVTCIDGYRMAQDGCAGAALTIAALGSLFAGIFGTFVLALFGPVLAELAVRFQAPEYFSLMTLGLLSAVVLANGSVLNRRWSSSACSSA